MYSSLHGQRLLLAFNGARAKGRDISFPWSGFNPCFGLTSHSWFLVRRRDGYLLAEGPVSELLWVDLTRDGIELILSGNRAIRLFVGSLVSKEAQWGIMETLMRVRVAAADFPLFADQQVPVTLRGQYLGGYGTGLTSDTKAVVWVGGSGIAALAPGASWLRATRELRGVQIGGVGEYSTGGGWVGGGFGVAGALEGAAFAEIMNLLTTRRHVETLIRLVYGNAEATFAIDNYVPGRLEIELAALLATLRGSGSHQGNTRLNLTTVAAAPTTDSVLPPGQAARFCVSCGTRRLGGAAFCGGCGERFN